jgi:uncharacterized protein (TIGR03435 family)
MRNESPANQDEEARNVRTVVFAGLIFQASAVWAQPAPAFEVASIKPAAASNISGITGGPGSRDPGQLTCISSTIQDLIEDAYNVKGYQIRGPAVLTSERFDIAAKVPKGATKEDLMVMLQGLLAERFKLTLHRETKELPVYALAVNKGGAKLRNHADGEAAKSGSVTTDARGLPAVPPGPLGRGVSAGPKSCLTAAGAGQVLILCNERPVARLANALSFYVRGPVVDRTGLIGDFDYTLSFTPPDVRRLPLFAVASGPSGMDSPVAPDSESAPDLFAALKEQLGLKLEPSTGPVELLVIDHVEKTPTAN